MTKGNPSATVSKSYLHGTHRAVSPTETLAKVRPLLAHMGITRIANVTGLDRIGIPVVTVMRPNSRSVSVSQGKGVTLEAARASGVMEAIESFHAERIDLPLKHGSYNDLCSSHRLVNVEGLAMLQGRSLDKYRAMLWIEGRDLVNRTSIWLPYDVVHADYTVPMAASNHCFVASTNGLASGNNFAEAVVHGIAEVIERDANSLWNQLADETRAATRVDIGSIEDAECTEVLEMLRQAQLAVAIWDMTSDVAVPAFNCLIVDELHADGHSGAGAGCHPCREVALLRALTEAVQVRTNYITGSRDDLLPDEYTDEGIAAKLLRARKLMRAARKPGKNVGLTPNHVFPTSEQDIDWMLERLTRRAIEQVIAVDLTKPEFNVAVARVVIPGLEGPDDHEDYTPGARARAIAEVQG